jgi:glutamyl-tRNA(Gln) amidotransferase subunit E
MLPREHKAFQRLKARGWVVTAVNLPQFKGIMSNFTQPDKMFANEISDRLKVIACLERPNMLHSEQFTIENDQVELDAIRSLLKSSNDDAQLVIWGPPEDVATALGVIEERCRLAMEGVPNETRKSLPDGTTVFERVLPGPDRMYPDTDTAPIPIRDQLIGELRKAIPREVAARMQQLIEWNAPEDTHAYILRNNLAPLIERIVADCGQEPKFVVTFLGHTLKNIEGRLRAGADFTYERVYDLFRFAQRENLTRDILAKMLPVVYEHPNMHFDSVLVTVDFHPMTIEEILEFLPPLLRKFKEIGTTANSGADLRWVMGQLRRRACGNVPLYDLRTRVMEELSRG